MDDKNLKESLKEEFNKRAADEGVPALLDKIADETIAEDSEKLLEFLTECWTSCAWYGTDVIIK